MSYDDADDDALRCVYRQMLQQDWHAACGGQQVACRQVAVRGVHACMQALLGGCSVLDSHYPLRTRCWEGHL
jgi:hypothetical protein